MIAVYVGIVLVSTLQRGVLDHAHTTFPIFRQSFFHLMHGQNLYLAYPTEQGTGAADLFKYSPTAALLFGPFALPALPWGLLLWNALNAAALVLAVEQLLPRPRSTWALLIAAPAALSAVQSSSSNALMAGVLVLSFTALEGGRRLRGAVAIAAGTLVKLFPLGGVAFAALHPRPVRFAGLFLLSMAVLVALPLLVISPHELVAQYVAWGAMLSSDARDLTFGRSVMSLARGLVGANVPNWPLQLGGAILLVLPLARRRQRWGQPTFRRRFLGSLLVFVVLFNHQAEHQSFVIASVGLAAWYLTEPRTLWRTVLLLLCISGLDTVPYLLVWLTMQVDLHRGGARDDERERGGGFDAWLVTLLGTRRFLRPRLTA